MTVISIYGLVYLYDDHPINTSGNDDISRNYVSVSTYQKESLDEFLNEFPENTFFYKESYTKEDKIFQYMGLKDSDSRCIGLLENDHIDVIGELKGRIPAKSHEVLVTQNISNIALSINDYPDIFQNIEQSNGDLLIKINGKEYCATGWTQDENNQYETLCIEVNVPQIGDSIYFNEEEYKITGVLIVEDEWLSLPEIFMN